jgi:hypothetical protein
MPWEARFVTPSRVPSISTIAISNRFQLVFLVHSSFPGDAFWDGIASFACRYCLKLDNLRSLLFVAILLFPSQACLVCGSSDHRNPWSSISMRSNAAVESISCSLTRYPMHVPVAATITLVLEMQVDCPRFRDCRPFRGDLDKEVSSFGCLDTLS